MKRVQDENNKLVQENGHHVNIVKEMLSADMDGDPVPTTEVLVEEDTNNEGDKERKLKEKIKEQDKEIKNLKQRIRILEPLAHDQENNISQLREEVLAAKEEARREREITNTILEERQEARNSKGVSNMEIHSTPRPRTLSTPEAAPITPFNSSELEQNSPIRLTRSESVPDMSTKINIDSYHAEHSGTGLPETHQICEVAFKAGKVVCDDSCRKNHNLDYEKIGRGVCLFEFAEKDSCRRKNGTCWFSHEIPDEARYDMEIVGKLRGSLNKIQDYRESQNKKKLPIEIVIPENFDLNQEIDHFLGHIRQKLILQTSRPFSRTGSMVRER